MCGSSITIILEMDFERIFILIEEKLKLVVTAEKRVNQKGFFDLEASFFYMPSFGCNLLAIDLRNCSQVIDPLIPCKSRNRRGCELKELIYSSKEDLYRIPLLMLKNLAPRSSYRIPNILISREILWETLYRSSRLTGWQSNRYQAKATALHESYHCENLLTLSSGKVHDAS